MVGSRTIWPLLGACGASGSCCLAGVGVKICMLARLFFRSFPSSEKLTSLTSMCLRGLMTARAVATIAVWAIFPRGSHDPSAEPRFFKTSLIVTSGLFCGAFTLIYHTFFLLPFVSVLFVICQKQGIYQFYFISMVYCVKRLWCGHCILGQNIV